MSNHSYVLIALTAMTAFLVSREAHAGSAVKCTPQALTRGKTLFNQCAACHSSKVNEPSKAGPNLYNIFGSKAASSPTFTYSRAMRQSGTVWTAERLSDFLAAPRAVIKGTTMGYGGMKQPQDRAALICHLASPAMRSKK